MTPTIDEQRRQFFEWDQSEQRSAYRAARLAGGGYVGTEQQRWELFARRWRPANTPADGWTPPPLYPVGSESPADAA